MLGGSKPILVIGLPWFNWSAAPGHGVGGKEAASAAHFLGRGYVAVQGSAGREANAVAAMVNLVLVELVQASYIVSNLVVITCQCGYMWLP